LHEKNLLMVALLSAFASVASAQANDTLGKIKASGTVVIGVRQAGGGLSYAISDGKYDLPPFAVPI
jgi:glutamate/aspartate transport system substrate-binding protein